VSDLTLVSLFDGVGGFPLAFQRAGVKTVAVVEIDKHCREVTAKHFPHAAQFGDVTKVSGDDLRAVGFVPERGILTGGFPCQDLSIAGRGAGLAGERSGLFFEIVRLLGELRPKWFILENVPRLLSINGGRDMGTVLGALAELGYWVSWRVLDAQHFGVPQRRRRVFIVGCFGDSGGASAEVLFEPEGVCGDSPQGGEAGPEVAGGPREGVGVGGESVCVTGDIAHTLTATASKNCTEDGTGRGCPIVTVTSSTTHTHTSTLQGGGKRGYRIDAEAAAGNQLVVQSTP
jgi:DNA (cytosine-5)-methyltransferase 1